MSKVRLLVCIIFFGVIFAYCLAGVSGRIAITDFENYHGDARAYNISAVSVRETGSLGEVAGQFRKPPAYSVFMALAYVLFGTRTESVWVLQVLIYIATLVLMYKISMRFFDERWALVPVTIMAFFWGSAFYVFKIGPETLAVFLLLSFTHIIFSYQNKPSLFLAVVGAICMGMLVLTKPVTLYIVFFLAFYCGYHIYKNKNSYRALHLVTAGILFLLIVGGWMVRNMYTFGSYQIEPVGNIVWAAGTISEASWRDIGGYYISAIAGNYIADLIVPGYAADPVQGRFKNGKRVIAQKHLEGLSDLETEEFLTQEGLKKIKNNPIKYIATAAPGFIDLNGPMTHRGYPLTSFMSGSDAYVLQSHASRFALHFVGEDFIISKVTRVTAILILRMVWYCFLALVLYGFILACRQWRVWLWVLFIFVYFNVMHTALKVTSETRFIMPVRFFYFLFATLALQSLYKQFASQRNRDYRSSHLAAGKSSLYEEEIYRIGSYDDILWRNEKKVLTNELQKLQKITSDINYLDFACGTGRIISYLESDVAHSVGVDISESMLAVARGKVKQSKLVLGDLTVKDVLQDQKYDFITAFRFFLNAEPSLQATVLDFLESKLKNKESIFIFNIHGNIWSHRIFTKIWLMLHGRTLNTASYWGVKRMLEPYGIKIIRFYGFGFMPKIFYRIFGSRIMCAIDSQISKIPLSKYFSYNLIFVCRIA